MTDRILAAVVMSLCVMGCARTTPEITRSSHSILISFENIPASTLPADFKVDQTGGGGAAAWAVQEDATSPDGKRVMTQTSIDPTDARFPLCIYQGTSARDASVSVKFKAVSGKVDQAAGLIVRLKDKDNYYVARANALEDNVRLYKVVAGKRTQFAGVTHKVTPGEWHTLALRVAGSHFVISFDGKELLHADDHTFSEAGRIGLWTKADSVTEFDDLRISVEKSR